MTTSSLVTTTTTTTRALHEYSSQHHHDDPPATNTVSSSRIQCPCEKFAALSKIVDTLDSEETMRSLLNWLDGRTDERALREHQLLSCGKRSRCRFRYGTSFAILNAIRNACRQHLDHTTNLDENGNSDEVEGFSTPASKSSTAKPSISYDEAFPSLQSATASVNTTTEPTPKPHVASANILVPRKKPQHQQSKMATDTEVEQPNNTILVPKKKKHKRRIRPAQVTEPVDGKGLHKHSVWNTVQQQQPLMISSNASKPWGNIRNSSSSNAAVGWPSSQEPPLALVKKAATIPSVTTTPGKLSTPQLSVAAVMTTPKQDSTLKTTTTTTLTPTTKSGIVSPTSTPVKKAPPYHLDRLVTIYIALFRNMLVPSTPLELHFLVRLLVVEGDAPLTTMTEGSSTTTPAFRPIFADPASCQQFAAKALAQLKAVIRNLPLTLLRSLLRCEPFQRQCPELCQELKTVFEEYSQKGVLVDYPTEAVTGTHAILSLPFDKERDSRHNYKTETEVAVYKNREESRDAFLRELRTFMSVKGRVLRPQDMETAQERVRQESRSIMNGLMSVNMIWFAQFYCELLLQVGLAPVQETDQELLNIADRDKLQALHKRFSSRSTHASKSSKKISISQKPKSSSVTPLDEARVLFPGYQEFFFLFLHQLPFNFGFHLRARMAKTILDLLADLSPTDLEQKIMKLQLIARFLGFLVFSPNWHESGIDASKLQSIALADGMQQLDSLGLSVVAQMDRAWTTGQIVAGVPWVTELLRMAKWDSLTQTSKQFRQLLANLRGIQRSIVGTEESNGTGYFAPTMKIMSLYLERFFEETTGLPKLTSLPLSTLSPADIDRPESLDAICTGFSSVLVFAASPHMEDLLSLVNRIEKGVTSKTPAKARKLRPSIVSRNLGVEPSKLFEDQTQGDAGRLETPIKLGNSVFDPNWELPETETKTIETKLVEAFFHQHREIKLICEFAVDQVLKMAPKQIVSACIQSTWEEKEITEDSGEEEVSIAQALALNKAKALLESRMRAAVASGLEVFGPDNLHPRIASIATHLSISRGMVLGRTGMHTLIEAESSSRLSRRPKPAKQAEPHGALDGRCVTSLASAAIEDLTNAFDDQKSAATSHKVEDVLALIEDTTMRLRELAGAYESSVPTESSLRTVTSALLELDRSGGTIFRWCETLAVEEFYRVFLALFRLQLAVSGVSSFGLKRWAQAVDAALILKVVEASICSQAGNGEVAEILLELDDAGITDLDVLAKADMAEITPYGNAIVCAILNSK